MVKRRLRPIRLDDHPFSHKNSRAFRSARMVLWDASFLSGQTSFPLSSSATPITTMSCKFPSSLNHRRHVSSVMYSRFSSRTLQLKQFNLISIRLLTTARNVEYFGDGDNGPPQNADRYSVEIKF